MKRNRVSPPRKTTMAKLLKGKSKIVEKKSGVKGYSTKAGRKG